MESIKLTKDYRFTTELSDEGFQYELLLTEEGNQITLRRIDVEFERENYICAQGTLPVLRELVTSITCYYSHNCYGLGDMYEKALNVLVYKLFTQEEVKHLLQVFNKHFIVDLIETLLNRGKLDYLKD